MPAFDTAKIDIGNACFEVIVKPGFWGEPTSYKPRLHCHPTYEVHCLEHGSVRMRFESEVRSFEGPMLLLIPPKVYHVVEYCSPNAVKYNFEFSLSMSQTGESFRSYSQILSNISSPEIIKASFPSIDNYKKITKTPEEQLFLMRLHIANLIFKIFNMLKVKYTSVSPETSEKKSSLRKEIMVAQIMSYMEKNANHSLNLSDVSEYFGFSERQIERLLKEIMHDSFFSLLNKYRIRNAVVMISKGENNLAKVSEDCGFSNYVTFWNHFTKLNGMTPSDFQKRFCKKK